MPESSFQADFTRRFIERAQQRIDMGEDYVSPIRLIQLAEAIKNDLEDLANELLPPLN